MCYFVVIIGLGYYCEHNGNEKKSTEKWAKKKFKNWVVRTINARMGPIYFSKNEN